MAKVENEIGFEIKPLDYIALREGYVFVEDAIKIVSDMGFSIPLVLAGLFGDALKNAPILNSEEIEQFYFFAKPFLKNVCFVVA